MAESITLPETKIETEISELVYVRRDDGNYGGWKRTLSAEEISGKIEEKFLLCSYCRGMLRDACLTEKDGKQELACSVCVPKDQNKIIALLNRDSVTEKEVYCPFKSKGCDWTNELSELLHHLEECELFPVACPLGCRDEKGEVSRVERRGVETHRTCCPMRIIKCEYCNFELKSARMNAHLHNICVEFPIPCPNMCSEKFSIKRSDISIHLNQECPLSRVECPYYRYGCRVNVTRGTLDQHEKDDMHSHFKLATGYLQDKVVRLEVENENLKNTNQKFGTLLGTMSSWNANGTLKWEINGVKEIFSKNGKLFSDPFYVGLYKLQAILELNLVNQKVICSLSILKGEWDDLIKWPFIYKDTIVLINQLNPKHHFETKNTISKEDLIEFPECFQKPTSIMNRQFGFDNFLYRVDVLHAKFCRNDSITLHISVEHL